MTPSRRSRSTTSSTATASASPSASAFVAGLAGIERCVVPALVTAVTVALPLIPTESLGQGTMILLQVIVFLGLGVWVVGEWRRPDGRLHGGLVDVLLALFLAWFTLSAVRMVSAGQGRLAINVTWGWLAGGVLWLLTRQTLRSPRLIRAILVVQLALGASLAAYGFYQCVYVMPRDRAAFAQDPDAVLRAAGVHAPAGSALREQYRNRLESREPLATFALTNSLAGYLLPALLLSGGVLLRRFPGGATKWTWGAWLAGALLLATCLILTKSRSAYLATALGGAALVAIALRAGRPLGWKFPLAALVTLGALVAGATQTGYLDVQVLTEARKSLGYRWEYWQATLAMLRDFPLNGCGAGNFQAFYTAYKLPQSSEVVADPHNWVLEIASSAGWPALGLAVMALAAWGWRLLKPVKSADMKPSAEQDERAPVEEAGNEFDMPPAIVYVGAVLGIALGWINGLIAGYPLESALWLLSLPLGATLVLLLRGWVETGELHPSTITVGVVSLGVNLLAAGSLGFPAVALGWWLWGALALNRVESASPGRPAPRWLWGLMAASVVTWIGIFFVTCYRPVFSGQVNLALAEEALSRRQTAEGLAHLEVAAETDPWSAEPWRLMAPIRQRIWLATKDIDARRAFEDAVLKSARLDPRSHVARRELASLFLEAYRELNDRPSLENALALYADAVRLYPHSNDLRAQYAWTLWVAGETERSREEARRGLELDDQNPHREQKLTQRRIRDFPSGKAVSGQVSARPFGANARECLERLAAGDGGESGSSSTGKTHTGKPHAGASPTGASLPGATGSVGNLGVQSGRSP